MKNRFFPALQRPVSEIGIGTWQLGGTEWGEVTDEQAIQTLDAAADAGVTFIDTADIYGLGRSESLIGRFLASRNDRDSFFIATKLGRHPEPGWPGNFTAENIEAHTDASLQRLGVEAIDLTQTHCVPQEYLADGRVWQTLRDLRNAGKIKAFGASVESMDEAVRCLDVEGLASLQIIFNIFRQKPIEALFAKAQEKNVALIVRLPLASGLLAGKFSAETTFDESDHRHFNRDGQQFNVGETFAGLPFLTGVDLADQLRQFVPENTAMAQWALRWCLDFPEVTTVIPGAKHADQARANAGASDLPTITAEVHDRLRTMYTDQIHDRIRGVY